MESTPPLQEEPIEDLEWEEWDSQTSPLSFAHHCLAGSFAGVVEHTLLYPLDTVKTCWQSQVLYRATGGQAGCASAPCGIGGGLGSSSVGGGLAGVPQQSFSGTTTSTPASAFKNAITQPQLLTQQLQHHPPLPNHQQPQQQQGIWSTMKHLMQNGHTGGQHAVGHHHVAGVHHPLEWQRGVYANISHAAHNTTTALGGGGSASASAQHFAGEVAVDSFMDATTAEGIIKQQQLQLQQQQQQQQTIGTKGDKRPWSRKSRAVRETMSQNKPTTATMSSANTSSSVGNPSASSTTTTTNATGFKRLWRGVQTMFVGCIPAHALYFSSYEIIKKVCLDQNRHDHNLLVEEHNRAVHENHAKWESEHSHLDGNGNEHSLVVHRQQQQQQQQQQQHHQQHSAAENTLTPTQAMFAGGVATLLHDFVMTPMDTMKQRMQLGHYFNVRHAFCSIVWGDASVNTGTAAAAATNNGSKTTLAENAIRTGGEGWKGLYRSLPITVMTNVPYGMIMMTTNEWLRAVIEDGLYGGNFGAYGSGGGEKDNVDGRPFHFTTILLSGMGAGTIAAALTAPLDRVKTRLQTQRMGMVWPAGSAAGLDGFGGGSVNNAGAASGMGGVTHASKVTGATSAIMEERALAAARGEIKACPKMLVQDVKRTLFPSGAVAGASGGAGRVASAALTAVQNTPFTKTYYTTPLEAFQSILQEEGYRGLFRGTLPRVALHAPSVAISWTAYEMAKGWLVWCVD